MAFLIVAGFVKETLPAGEAILFSLLGMAIVFFVLAALIGVIKLLSMLLRRNKKDAGATAAPVAEIPRKVPAPGSLGELKLHNVDDQTAAMLMAIVADEMKTPLNQLRFLSIRQTD